MANFSSTVNPTPFGFYDSDAAFQVEADGMVTFVKRKLGDDVLSVELTKKEIWACFEEASTEYGNLVNQMQIVSDIANVLGMPTGSTDLTNKYPRRTMEYLNRQAEPYASVAGLGGSYNQTLAYIDLEGGRQDYDLYTELKDAVSGSVLFDSQAVKGKIRIVEVFHFEPLAAQHFLLNASNVTNFLATNFNYESYVNSTTFYVLPIFEDVLRRGMLEAAFRLRRSNYSYQIIGTKLRIFPIPVTDIQVGRLYVKTALVQDPLHPSYQDDSIYGISGPQNAPYSNIPFTSITSTGRQWIRQYCLALSRELLGITRNKLKSIPVPGGEVTLDGADLIAQGREDKDKLRTELREWLDNFTADKIMEREAAKAESIANQLKYVPIPLGKSIVIG